MKYLALALLLTGCGLLNDIEEVLDPPPEAVEVEQSIPDKPCAQDSIQALDTRHYAWCAPEIMK